MPKRADGSFRSLLTDARVERAAKAVSIDKRLARLRTELGVATLAKQVEDYARATADVDHVRGPWTLHGFAAKLPPAKSCGELFGKLGKAAFPALRIGSDRRGIDFWLVAASGQVITLHHDASFYEQAARCGGTTAAAFAAELAERGSAFDLAQLVRLQLALHESKWSTELERQQVWARAAAGVLGVPLGTMANRAEQLAFELLHLEPEVVGDLAVERKTRSTRGKLPPPLAEALAQRPRTLDLAGVLDAKLPAAVAELAELEEIDLSANPRLDFEAAFETLSALPRLRVVKFADCRLESLPATLGKLQALDELDLSSSVFKGPHNSFVLDQIQPILANLPKLRSLDVSACRGPADLGAFVAALPAIERLNLDAVSMSSFGYAAFSSSGSSTLQELSLRLLGVDALLAVPPSRFPRLRKLALYDAVVNCQTDSDDWHERDRSRKERIVELIEWLAQLPALESLDLRIRGMDLATPPPAIAKLRVKELWLNAKRLPKWIGKLRSLRSLHLRYLREPLPGELGELSELEELDLGGMGSDETCKVDTLPPEIGALAKLRSLTLLSELASWPSELRRCRALEVLRCVDDGPPFLRELASLRRSDGAVSELVHLPKLEAIDLSRATRVPEELARHPAIRRVRWWAYALEEDFDAALERVLAVPALESLQLAYVPRTQLPRSLLRPPLHTLELNVADRDYPGIDLDALCTLLAESRIESLRLFTHERVTVPPSLAKIATLRKLELHGIGFTQLPALDGLANLRHLVLTQTKIGAPERKRVRAALPGCRVTVDD